MPKINENLLRRRAKRVSVVNSRLNNHNRCVTNLILHFSGEGVEKGLTNPRITEAAATKNDEDLVQEIIMTKDKDTKMIIKKSCVIIAITEKRRISIRENLEVEAEKDAIESSTIEHLK